MTARVHRFTQLSREWHQAGDAAIGFVARADGRALRSAEIRALERFEGGR